MTAPKLSDALKAEALRIAGRYGEVGFVDMLVEQIESLLQKAQDELRLEIAKKVCISRAQEKPLRTSKWGTQHYFKVGDDEASSYWPCRAVELGVLGGTQEAIAGPKDSE